MRRRGTTTPRGLGARGRVAVVAGLAVGVGGGVVSLGGCTGEPEPAPTQWWTPVYDSPWPEPTPTPTPTPTIAPPERPAAMDEANEAGAEAVARYFLDLYSYAYATGDLEAWQALSHPECVFCASVAQTVEAQRSAEEHTLGGELVATEAYPVAVTPDVFFTVDVRGGQEAWELRDSTGTLLASQEEFREHRYFVVVVRENDAWLVRGVQVDDAPA